VNLAILSVKEVPGPMRPDGGTFEIVAQIVQNGITKDVTWYYSPGYKGHEERIDTNEPENPEDFPMRNPFGVLLLGLLQEFLTRENPVTSKMMKSVEKACGELEGLL
jgi:hypothetical protein